MSMKIWMKVWSMYGVFKKHTPYFFKNHISLYHTQLRKIFSAIWSMEYFFECSNLASHDHIPLPSSPRGEGLGMGASYNSITNVVTLDASSVNSLAAGSRTFCWRCFLSVVV